MHKRYQFCVLQDTGKVCYAFSRLRQVIISFS